MAFFIVVTIVASLNDYWKILKLDILFAPDKKKDSKDETDDQPNSAAESSNEGENKNDCECVSNGILNEL